VSDEPADEPVEEIDADGRVLRVVARGEVRAGRLRHRAVFIAVLAHDGRILIHQRSPLKDLWPSRWDVAAGGVVGVGERDDAAAARELGEELGVGGTALERIGRAGYEDDEVALIGTVYRIVHDGPFRFADGEVVAARWVTFEELDGLRRSERFCPDSLAVVLPLL